MLLVPANRWRFRETEERAALPFNTTISIDVKEWCFSYSHNLTRCGCSTISDDLSMRLVRSGNFKDRAAIDGRAAGGTQVRGQSFGGGMNKTTSRMFVHCSYAVTIWSRYELLKIWFD